MPPENIFIYGEIGDHPHLTWTDHPNEQVTQYQIWRKFDSKWGGSYPPGLVTTLNRGTTSFTDYMYTVTYGYEDGIASYDVRSYWSFNGTYSDPDFAGIFATDGGQQEARKDLLPEFKNKQSVTKFQVGAYPNPFNPSTVISWQLPEASVVTIQIFDILGRNILILDEGVMSAGYHQFTWQGRSEDGRQLESGIYLYRFEARVLNTKKMYNSSGRLVLVK